MASERTASSKSWFFPTSPRSPYKLQGELKLLKQLEGKPWGAETQQEFAKLLMESPDFEGKTSRSEAAFSGRDRATRAPRLLGFVHFPRRGQKGAFKFTEIGNIFIQSTPEEQALIFQRQIAKVQFRSPLHNNKGFGDMSIRPLIVMLRLLFELDSLSKHEIALFAITITSETKFNEHVAVIRQFRESLSNLSGLERKSYKKSFSEEWVGKIYEEDILAGRTKLRQGGDDFISKKFRTLIDYADSTIRYLRATGLFTVQPHGQRLVLAKAAMEDAEYLIKNHSMASVEVYATDYDGYIEHYLGNASTPKLRKDEANQQLSDVDKLAQMVKKVSPHKAEELVERYHKSISSSEKLKVLGMLEREVTKISLSDQAKLLRANLVSSTKDVQEQYDLITTRGSDVLDRPLMYEWNTWRALVLINDAMDIVGNYIVDFDGYPVSTAAGNKPDIEAEYKDFHLIVEVTLSAGQKQYEMEGESISRHLGMKQKRLVEEGNFKPVFGVFVAEKINDNVVNYLLTQARFASKAYGGKVRIVPLKRSMFEKLMISSVTNTHFTSRVLFDFFTAVFSDEILRNFEFTDEDWLGHISECLDELGAVIA